MKNFTLGVLVTLGILAVAAGVVIWPVVSRGVSARDEPSAIERLAARSLRRAATPGELRQLRNPVPLSPAVISDGLAHFADHCALCHGNDGTGDTFYGRSMYPPTPDLTRSTRQMTDGEIYAVIENGVRLTGMPAFGDGTPDNAPTWHLVHFIRHLPEITPAEIEQMRALNPKSPAALAAERARQDAAVKGEPPPAQLPTTAHDGHDHVH